MIEFAFYHCIVDDDPDLNAEALALFGRAMAAWGRLEHHIDAVLIHINKEHRAPAIYQEHPVAFSKKINLLKRWFNQYPPLAEFSEDIRILTSKLSPIAKTDRNLFSHSILAGFDQHRKVLTFHSMQVEGDNVRSRHVEYSADQMTAFFEVIQIGNRYLSHISTALFTEEWTERLEKP